MSEFLFFLILSLLLASYLAWGFVKFPHERWQFLAAVPVQKIDQDQWRGVNLTWYGLLTANAYVAAVMVLFVMLEALHAPLGNVAVMVVALLAVCVPASRLVARIVEGKRQTFTVGGAVFVGYLAAPPIIEATNRVLERLNGPGGQPMAVLAAFAIAYAFGEGLGRLACISFGCCYGKRLADSPQWLRRLFAGRCFTFSGKTKKIAYGSNCEGIEVIPIQAITAVLYVVTGLLTAVCFLHGRFAAAFILATAVTQGWRVVSEFFRADFRGDKAFSAYQIMGLLTIPYSCALMLIYPANPAVMPDLDSGLRTMSHSGMLLFLQLLWLVIFAYTGRSTVTGSRMLFHVHRDRI